MQLSMLQQEKNNFFFLLTIEKLKRFFKKLLF